MPNPYRPKKITKLNPIVSVGIIMIGFSLFSRNILWCKMPRVQSNETMSIAPKIAIVRYLPP